MYLSCLRDKKNFAHFGGLTKMYLQKFKFKKKFGDCSSKLSKKISNFKVPMIFVIEHFAERAAKCTNFLELD